MSTTSRAAWISLGVLAAVGGALEARFLLRWAGEQLAERLRVESPFVPRVVAGVEPRPEPRHLAPPEVGHARSAPVAPTWVPAELPYVEALIEAFCAPMARSVCAARERCCVRRAPTCEDDLFASCTEWALNHDAPDHPAGGEPDPGAIRTCLAELERRVDACDVDRAYEHCWRLGRSRAELGEGCPPRASCRGGMCDRDGICQALPQEGDLVSDLPCPLPLRELAGVCADPAREGERCSGFHTDCEGDLVCFHRTCTRLGRVGDRCFEDDSCALGLGCVEDRCTAMPIWCEDDATCGAGHLCLGDPGHRCVPRRGRAGPVQCDDGARCGRDEMCEDLIVGGRCEPLLCSMEYVLSDYED
jgi:hypothetical protein